MSCWQVIIDDIDVSEFIPSDSLDGLTTTVEANHLHDYRADDTSFNMDDAALELFELEKHEFYQLKHTNTTWRRVNIFYYGVKKFGGFVQKVARTRNDIMLQVDVISIATMVVNSPLDTEYIGVGVMTGIETFETEDDSMGGDSLTTIATRLINRVNMRSSLLESGPELLHPEPSIDVEDFTSYGFPMVTLLGTPSFTVAGYEYSSPVGILQEVSTEKIFMLFRREQYPPEFYTGWGWVELTEAGLSNTIEIREHQLVNGAATIPGASDDDPAIVIATYLLLWDDDAVLVSAVEAQLGFSGGSYLGKAKIGNTYYGLITTGMFSVFFFNIVIDSTDLYQYQFSKPTAGEVLRDLGIMTDSLVWIDPDGVLHFQTRSGISEIPSIAEDDVKSIQTETLDRRKERLELPEAFTIALSVRTEIVNHYDPVYRGAFNRSAIEIEREAVEGYTLPLRSITIGGADYRTIKEMVLHENSIELATEKRL
ncbi:hypothetical protein HQ531_02480 [bacterium]|nr:hypothetical protein [bacterium]